MAEDTEEAKALRQEHARDFPGSKCVGLEQRERGH